MLYGAPFAAIVDRRDHHVVATAVGDRPLAHRWQTQPSQMMCAEGVGADDVDHLFRVSVDHGTAPTCDTRVADQHVDAAELRKRLADHRRALISVGNRPGNRRGDTACLTNSLHRRLGRVLIAVVVHRHRCTVGSQQFADRSPDAPPPATDQGDAPIELSHVPS
jgi:hypothetical protein